jgi:hypothetical protein
MVRTERTTSRAQAACSATELHPVTSGWTDSNRRPRAPRARALTKLRHNPLRRDPRSRTASLLNPNQADCRLPRSRWRRRESNPLRRRLRGVPGTLPVIPIVAPRRFELLTFCVPCRRAAICAKAPLCARGPGFPPGTPPLPGRLSLGLPPGTVLPGGAWLAPPVLTLWTYQKSSTFTLRWCSAGTAGVEPAFRPGWSRAA